jgi:hypothetical protein
MAGLGPGLGPAIHAFSAAKEDMDGRDKHGHDDSWLSARVFGPARRSRTGIAALAFIGAFPLAAIPGGAQPPSESPVAIEIRSEPISAFDFRDSSRRQFGLLEFRGGLVLRSRYGNFGGLSAIRMAADGANFIAVNDRGWWLRGRTVYDGTRLSGIADAEMAPILGFDGQPLSKRGWYDAEAIAEDGGTLYLGFERVHQIARFNYGKSGLLARGQPIPVPAGLRALASNRGIEGLVFVPKGSALAGTLIAVPERGPDRVGNVHAFLIGGPSPGSFAIRRSAGYDASDLALLPGGDILLLERKFSWTAGLTARIRRLALGEIMPGALVDGPTLFEADLGYEIDNMEGISVHKSGGETVLTLVSDDNFSFLQRTLLLQFTLAEP